MLPKVTTNIFDDSEDDSEEDFVASKKPDHQKKGRTTKKKVETKKDKKSAKIIHSQGGGGRSVVGVTGNIRDSNWSSYEDPSSVNEFDSPVFQTRDKDDTFDRYFYLCFYSIDFGLSWVN